MLIAGFLSRSVLSLFFLNNKEQPAEGWHYPQWCLGHSTTKKMPHIHGHKPIQWGKFLSWGSFYSGVSKWQWKLSAQMVTRLFKSNSCLSIKSHLSTVCQASAQCSLDIGHTLQLFHYSPFCLYSYGTIYAHLPNMTHRMRVIQSLWLHSVLFLSNSIS